MQFTQLDHVALHVEDVEASCRFYGEALMLESLPRPAFDFPGAWFRLGKTQELHLIGRRDSPVLSGDRGNHFALQTDDLDACETHLRDQGVTIERRQIRPDGAGQIFITDPDGHYIELCSEAPQ
jgi:lactoylglutathione lyase